MPLASEVLHPRNAADLVRLIKVDKNGRIVVKAQQSKDKPEGEKK